MYPKDGETLDVYVKRCRLALKLTQSAMARKININTQSLGKIEFGCKGNNISFCSNDLFFIFIRYSYKSCSSRLLSFN